MAEQKVGAAVLRQPWLPQLRRTLGIRTRTTGDHAAAGAVRALVGSRALVWFAGLTTIALFGHNSAPSFLDAHGLTAPFGASWLNAIFAPATRWDSVWYLEIAHHGYASGISPAFYPLYPLLMRLGGTVLGSPLTAGVAISLVSMAVALYYLERLARLDLGASAARTTVLLVAFFPTAFFLSAVYTDSLFLALSVGALYAARLNRWAIASLLGALGAASRPNGALIVLPLIALYLYGPQTLTARGVGAGWPRAHARPSRTMFWLVLVPLGLVGYLAYLWITQDTPLAPFQAEAWWGRHFAGPFGAVVKVVGLLPHDVHALLHGPMIRVTPGDAIPWAAHDLIDIGFLFFAALGVAFSWRRLPIAYTVYSLAMLAEVLSYPQVNEPLQSFPRYVLIVFPLFMGWGIKLSENRLVSRAVLLLSAAGLVLFTGLFAYWDWVA